MSRKGILISTALSSLVYSAGERNAFESTRFHQPSQVPRNVYGKAVWRF